MVLVNVLDEWFLYSSTKVKDGQNKRDELVESPGETGLFCEDSYGPPPVTNLKMFWIL